MDVLSSDLDKTRTGTTPHKRHAFELDLYMTFTVKVKLLNFYDYD